MIIPGLNGKAPDSDQDETPQFGFHEEEAIISLILDMPEFFATFAHLIKPEFFARMEARYVLAWILNAYEKHDVVLTRPLLRDQIARQLTIDEPYQEIINIIDRKSNPREVPVIRGRLKDWARSKAFGLLYDEETITAYQRGDFERLEEVFNLAARINDTTHRGFWFFDEFEQLLNPENITHYPTGFKRLDLALNDGGPSPGEVVVWLAATNVGKSIFLCNNSINSIRNGLDTLHITFEMSAHKTARRCLGAMTAINLKNFHEHKETIRDRLMRLYTTNKARLGIYEMNPDECSVADVVNLITTLRRTKGWSPKVVVLDYLELMISRNKYYNRDDYVRQKHIATEVCGLAKQEQVLVYTATQTNRSGTGTANQDDVASLNKMAESYGKAMPPDYVISLNQSLAEYQATPPQIRMYIAKNREGEKFVTITCHVNYGNMQILESPI